LNDGGCEVEGGFGLDLRLVPGVGAACMTGLAIPEQPDHRDERIDVGRLTSAVGDGQLPLAELVA
jgi:hypothetical protein